VVHGPLYYTGVHGWLLDGAPFCLYDMWATAERNKITRRAEDTHFRRRDHPRRSSLSTEYRPVGTGGRYNALAGRSIAIDFQHSARDQRLQWFVSNFTRSLHDCFSHLPQSSCQTTDPPQSTRWLSHFHAQSEICERVDSFGTCIEHYSFPYSHSKVTPDHVRRFRCIKKMSELEVCDYLSNLFNILVTVRPIAKGCWGFQNPQF